VIAPPAAAGLSPAIHTEYGAGQRSA
jgi:hypothetical protein